MNENMSKRDTKKIRIKWLVESKKKKKEKEEMYEKTFAKND